MATLKTEAKNAQSKKIKNAIEVCISLRNKNELNWEERDSIALLCNLAEEVIKLCD